MDRRTVKLRNFSIEEGQCKCGKCKKPVSDDHMVCLQAFIFRLERAFRCKIRCIITSGGRCEPHQRSIYGIKDKPEDPTPKSYHLGPRRIDEKLPSEATDCIFDKWNVPLQKWETIPREIIAYAAKQSGLFGGVGHLKYKGDKSEFVHLDSGTTREF